MDQQSSQGKKNLSIPLASLATLIAAAAMPLQENSFGGHSTLRGIVLYFLYEAKIEHIY